MFHHRSVGFPSSLDSNGNHARNENLIHHGSQLKPSGSSKNNAIGGKAALGNPSKTPAGKKSNTSTRRRAFGDISNKKSSRTFGKDAASSAIKQQKPLPNDNALRPRSSNLLPRSSRSVASGPTMSFAILPENPKHPVLQKKQTESKQKRDLKGPSSNSLIQSKPRLVQKVEPVPDIEFPAGRTWKQQLEYDLRGEDDIASLSSLDSLLHMKDFRNPQARWEAQRELEWKRRKEEAEADDMRVKAEMNAIFDKNEDESDDDLYDVFENLDILDDDNVDGKGNGFLQEDWSHLSDSSVKDDFLFPL